MSRDQDSASKQSTVPELLSLIGSQLRQERIRQRLEQQDLADRAGVARTAVSRVENGQGGTLGTFVAMVRALGHDDWISGLAPQASVSPMDLITRQRAAPQRVRKPRKET
jgi:transcriptional regulator with XRE-family HTH domain